MNQERVFQILMGPHVSEKAAIVADANNQYVFKVAVDATIDANDATLHVEQWATGITGLHGAVGDEIACLRNT